MAKCKKCNDEIIFGPHQVSGKLTPLNKDGSIHFQTCSGLKDELYTARNKADDILKCLYCGSCFSHAYWITILNGQKRLRPAFKCGHKSSIFLAHTEYNISLVNKEDKL